MSDILFDNLVFDRLREIGDQSQRICELESEIARLRLTDATQPQDATPGEGSVHGDGTSTLTDAEREAVEWASKTLCVGWHDLAAGDKQRTRAAAATLRALLARLSPPAA